VQIKRYFGAKEFRNCVKIDPKGLLSNPAIEKISASERLVLAIPKLLTSYVSPDTFGTRGLENRGSSMQAHLSAYISVAERISNQLFVGKPGI
jgi:hypothetical protein